MCVIIDFSDNICLGVIATMRVDYQLAEEREKFIANSYPALLIKRTTQ